MKTIPLVQPGTSPANGGDAAASAGGANPAGDGGARFVPDPERTEALKPAIIDAISTVYDPEIPVNIWELGLIYDIAVDAAGVAGVTMTLTAPGCPAAQSLPGEVAERVRGVAGVADAKVEVVWEPAWDKDRMSEAARLQLGLW